MRGKSLFVDRVIARPASWQVRVPSLLSASRSPVSVSAGRQVVVATADARNVRCLFCTSLGAVLDFRATWAELETARGWWEFAIRWHFWIFPDQAQLDCLAAFGPTPAALVLDSLVARTTPDIDASVLQFLDAAERHATTALEPEACALTQPASPSTPRRCFPQTVQRL